MQMNFLEFRIRIQQKVPDPCKRLFQNSIDKKTLSADCDGSQSE
jgi:hypothetical protein